jgi:hypothetical protein
LRFVSGEPGAAGEQGDLVSRLRAVIGAKDEQIAVLTAALEASLDRERRLELRLAEVERRLSMDSTDSWSLLKIAYSILKTGTPYADPGADFYTRRESPDARQDYLMRQLHKLNPGCVITITPTEAA